jgi:hypothetical protein
MTAQRFIALPVLLLALCADVRGQQPQVIPLWERGAPGFEARRDEPEQPDDEYVADVLFDLTRKYHDAGVSIEAHIYAQGKHAFNMGQRSEFVSIRHWPQRLAEWLQDRGLIKAKELIP